ncbi:MAG: 2-keto-4-pentenoate hydratase/2-oxohepta-3-ene-1,7-dioic acid hydratase (catechol pathway) [halophilic archaeon J07HX64]|jgi:2-keto-4-pentenoate hydratase/2-oxohepta-3-ene-1,7-dioic acid hydratase (catechol pathway)|nr:MAG: 2-keto-4-pentenoate hydratase/2-oxohepta-3-ene-1,7-dioic acid hydratase (catechol pathway) [halophilic archaeon J07HX64]
MKRVRFRDPAGAVRTGEWVAGDGSQAGTDTAGTAGFVRFGDQRYDPGAVTVLPPCEPSKLVCIGRNYADHADEMGGEVPDRPLLFLKPPNTVASHGSDISLPAGKQVDYEAELGVVIGQQCRNVDRSEAMGVVAGYTCVVDLSNRDDQRTEQNWVRGKAFDGAAPLGPVLATPEHVPADASIELRVNGDRRQSASRAQLIFSVPELIAEITSYLTLQPGDVIATGTPEGVGPLEDGDDVEVRIQGVGRLVHTVTRPG